MKRILYPEVSWVDLKDTRLIPAKLSKRLRSYQDELDQITPDRDELLNKINLINESYAAAESLPTDLKALSIGREKLDQITTSSIEMHAKISENKEACSKKSMDIAKLWVEAQKIVSQCEEAYRITTTKGLAAAFDQRANRISSSMWFWVGGLVSALVIGGYIGSRRVETLSDALSRADRDWGVITVHILLSVITVGAPLWFAWLSTKQIGQRFKISEDYAFKASVAKAYEGYRKEAARINEDFEARLFESALSRLEEAPLRLVEETNHSSPMQEILNSEAVIKAASIVPELPKAIMDAFNVRSIGKPKSTEQQKDAIDSP